MRNMQRIILISILVCLTYLTTPTSSASKYYDGESRPYEFGFKIEKNQHRYEKRDENGIVMGQFGFVTADGIYHVTVYATDENGSFKIVSMRNVKVAEIDDVFNIGPGAPTPKFEIVPLKATTPSSYNAVTSPPKLNAPFVQPKQVTERSCSNCIRPTTQPPIPITFAPVQHNTQKPFGIGLPEKLTTYQQYDATPKPVVTAINRFDLPNGDEYTQIRTPEDQTQPIRKGSVAPTVSNTPFQSFQPEQPQNVQFTPVKLVSTVKDSIQKVSLQQAQNADVPKPSAIFQTQPPVTPVPELTIQPPLLNNEFGEQPQVNINPSPPTEFQFNEPVAPVRELNVNPQSQSIPNEPIEQPVYTQLSNVPQTQPDQPGSNPVRDDIQFFQPETPQYNPVEQPVEYNKFTTPSQDYFEKPASPIIDPVSLVHEDLKSPIQQQQPPSYVESVEPALPVQGFVQNIQPQVQQGPVNPISPIAIDTYSNIPTIELGNDIENDYGKVLVVEPLSPNPQVRINLPKPINAPPGQIPNLPAPVLNDIKDRMLELRNKPTPASGAAPPEPIRQFQNKFNVQNMENILGDILYRFNYTAGYHGHHEQGDRDGNKEGGYYLVSRDGYRRIVEYTADEDGYRPRIHLEYAQPQDVPQPETEKEKGLGGSEFKWFYVI